MLTIDIPSMTYEVPKSWNGTSKKLIKVPPIHLEMEHSLISIAKWEGIWGVPFMEQDDMTTEQFLSYCQCMTINRQKDPDVYNFLRKEDAVRIIKYMNQPMSAWKIKPKANKKAKARRPEREMCAEFFYWLMFQYGIPMECEKWHLQRLIALLDFIQDSNGDNPSQTAPKMNFNDRMRHYMELNMKRCKELGTRG